LVDNETFPMITTGGSPVSTPKTNKNKSWLKVIRLCAVSVQDGALHLTAEVSLDKVYEEVKRMRLELKIIEKSLDSLLESLIPEGEELTPEEAKELDILSKEMDEGNCVPIEQVVEKYGAKKSGKVPPKRSQKNR